MPAAPLDIGNEFRAILTADSVRAATPADGVCGLQPQLVLEPADEKDLAAAVRLANDNGLAVIPRGGGTKLAWGHAPARADVILSTKRLDKIIEHIWADLTVTAQAGCRVQDLQDALARHNQRLAIDPLWPLSATIGGILSTNDSGALRMRFGALRDLIIGVTLALPDGTLASSGGKVVKNVAGYDLPKLVTGAFGTLGVITRAVFRLHPLPRHTKTLTIAPGNLDALQRLILAVQDSQLAHTSLQVRMAANAHPLVDILFEGTEEGIAAQADHTKALAASAPIREESSAAWDASQNLWDSPDSSAIAKITLLPAGIRSMIESIERSTGPRNVAWRSVIQAMGVGCLRLDGSAENLRACLAELRVALEASGGSVVIRHRPAALTELEAWGKFGDALALMRAVKNNFDPRDTLNPGRFI
jgi:glycolate oxidase FAD binding subunit